MANRPIGEKWELVGGKIVETHSATRSYQVIIGNLIFELETARRAIEAKWVGLMGIGVRVPRDDRNEAVPDVMVMPRSDSVVDWTHDAIAVFEVTSPLTIDRDMVHKRNFYTRIQSLTHYVVLAQDRMEATVFARSEAFSPVVLSTPKDRIDIASLGVSLSLADIYSDVPVG